MATFYIVQSYSAAKGGFTADSPVPAQSANQAVRMAERLAERKPMVLAFVREGNEKTGEYDDPKLLFTHGNNLPEELDELEWA
ncbi:hypothetical protein FHS77_002702 [Paenochrobactrum gallinarii]|uniref:Uncharacterized protein n=1 Tax=Paenochrobactrum gallinarii TaxID=643673 RepID=A0A841M9B3_9HYPH|nr:hypothetical protein [Paenochrobactrum gallinarii]MBB6262134.1 hypothetical protein [Paenochrobactrum gallinarii]